MQFEVEPVELLAGQTQAPLELDELGAQAQLELERGDHPRLVSGLH